MLADYTVLTPSQIVVKQDASLLMGSVEAEWVFANWLFNIGLSNSDADITPNDNMRYISLAYPLNDITPFVYFSKRSQVFETFDLPPLPTPPNGGEQPPPANPAPLAPPDGISTSYSTAVGARWNLADKLSVKFQVERLKTQDNARPSITNISASGTALSVVLEGVF
jgi:hypothetical protein